MATGLALLVTPLLGNTALAGIAPITDALLVIAVSLVLLLEPLLAQQEAMGQAAGLAADPRILQQTREVLMQELSVLQLQMMDFTVQQLGRTAFVVVYINPLEALDSAVVDGLRHHIEARCSKELQQPVRSEIILICCHRFIALIHLFRRPLSVSSQAKDGMTDQQLWDAVVIGSGIGGLVTASQLAAKGAKVLVLERYLIPGGSGGAFKRDGYTFDVGASMIFGFGEKGYTNLLTRALADVDEHCDTIPDQAQLEYHMPGGLNIAVDRDYETFIADLSARFPHEATGIRHFYDTCWQVFNCLDTMPLLSLEDPAYLTKVFFKAPLACLGLARWLPFNVGAVARQHIKDEQLLKFIDIECFCWSVMPADRTPMINAGMVFSDRHAGGINYPKGGVGVIAEKLVQGLERHGGAIRYKARVTEVEIDNGRAIGVKLADGSSIRARRVISNATRWDTFSSNRESSSSQALVNQANTPAKEDVWRRRYVPSPSFLSLHLGVRADLIPKGTHCHHLLLEDWGRMEDEQGVIFVSMPSLLDPDLAPAGHHIVHTFTPSSMKAWKELSPREYKQKKDTDAARLIQRLETILPGLNDAITHREIGTPRSHRRFLGRFQGSYGPIPALQLPGLLPMPFNRTGIQNLYCVGDSCFPGQGLNAVAFSGFACAHRVGADLGLNPWALPD